MILVPDSDLSISFLIEIRQLYELKSPHSETKSALVGSLRALIEHFNNVINLS